MLHVHRAEHADPGLEQLVDVLPALRVPRPGRIGVRQFVDDDHLGPARQHRLHVELLQDDAAVGDPAAGEHLETGQLLGGAPSPVCLDQPDDDVGTACRPAVRLPEDGEGLADAGGGCQVDAQRPATHGAHDHPPGEPVAVLRVRIVSRPLRGSTA